MKNQALFSSKDKNEKLKCRLLQFFIWRFKGQKILNTRVRWWNSSMLETHYMCF